MGASIASHAVRIFVRIAGLGDNMKSVLTDEQIQIAYLNDGFKIINFARRIEQLVLEAIEKNAGGSRP